MPRSLDHKILKLALLIFLPLALILNFMIFRVYINEKNSRLTSIEAIEMEYVDGKKKVVEEKLNDLGSDLAFLSSLDEVISFFENGSTEERKRVESLFVNFSKSRGLYDQIRLLGLDGMELLRVDSRPSLVHAVSSEGLQDKSCRYYFKDALEISPEDTYMSPMDLNIEHGNVEIPYVPMVRIGAKVINGSGDVVGILFLNCYGDFLFPVSHEDRDSVYHSILMVNGEGYYFKGLTREDEWGFMFEDKKDLRMSVKHPDLWEMINKSATGQRYDTSGLYSFTSLSPLKKSGCGASDESRTWTILSFIPSDEEVLSFRKISFFYLFLGGGTTILLFLLVFWVVRIFEREKNRALVDPLTSLWNRRSFIERLNRVEGRMGEGSQVCIALIDLGNFKHINDACGHQSGDEALVLASQVFLSEVRTTDFVGRYGGDEFVILFQDLAVKEAESVMLRLSRRISDIHIPSCKNGKVVADWGLVHYPSESKTIYEALELADARMYESKRKRKEVSQKEDS